jgi:hypothetical protein
MYALVRSVRGTRADLRRQLLQQCLSLFQIARVARVSNPSVNQPYTGASSLKLTLQHFSGRLPKCGALFIAVVDGENIADEGHPLHAIWAPRDPSQPNLEEG